MPLPFRPHLQEITAYDSGKPLATLMQELGLSRVINLAANENPWGPSPAAIEALQIAAPGVNRYPSGPSFALRDALSDFLGVSPKQVFLGNGSDECIRMVAECLLENPSDEIVVGDPTFVCYSDAAGTRNARVTKVPLNATGTIDLEGIAGHISENTKIVYLSNPNNPTGTAFSHSELSSFLNSVPETVAIVLDEAYFEYANRDPENANGIGFLNRYSNVIVLRTFSKAYGLAGLRCGYGIASEEFVQMIQKVRMPFNVNLMAQVACLAALQDQPYLESILDKTLTGRDRLETSLQSIGGTAFQSRANFVYADFQTRAGSIVHNLLSQGFLVRACAVFGSPEGIRISVGTEQEMDLLIDSLQKLPQELVQL